MLVFSKSPTRINENNIDQVPFFKYLGTTINQQCDPKTEIRSRTEQASSDVREDEDLFHKGIS